MARLISDGSSDVSRTDASLSFITRKWIKTGMNGFFWGGQGILDWFKNM